MKAEIFVLYHAHCNDGMASAWVCWRKFGDAATYMPVYYQRPIPEGIPDGAKVYIVDFSYPRRELSELSARCDVVVIDHHENAMNDLSGFSNAIFNMDRCGAISTWQHFFPEEPVPLMLKYVDDRDRWQHKLLLTRQIYAAMRRSLPYKGEGFDLWNKWVTMSDDEFVEEVGGEGQPIFEKRMIATRKMAHRHAWIEIAGYKVPFAFAPKYWSDVGNLLCQLYLEYPFAACWSLENGDLKIHLRSLGFNTVAIATKFGGDGRGPTSGFSMPLPRFWSLKWFAARFFGVPVQLQIPATENI